MQETQVRGLNERVVNLLGRLHYRTSYSQNVLRHSIEVAFVAGMIAEEMGMNADLARRAGLLHDIGKAADHDTEGGHPQIGADLLKRYGEGAGSGPRRPGPSRRHPRRHALHGARRGGRRLQRVAPRRPPRNARPLHQADAGAGNDRHRLSRASSRRSRSRPAAKSASSPAPSITTDESAAKICRDIAKAFEEQLTYPGEIKVTMIRETRFTETAK